MGALRFDAGSLSLNLVATVGRRFGEPVERLDSLPRLSEWLTGVGLAVSASFDEGDLARIHSLREQLDEVFRSALAGRQPPARAIEAVNAAAAAAVPGLRATGRGLALASPPPGGRQLDPVRALIAADATRILAGEERFALRSCEAEDCRMLYLAPGRRARRWCSSEHCGNRSRVAAHRARKADFERR